MFNSNEERLAEAARLGRERDIRLKIAHDEQWKPYGGSLEDSKRSCQLCRYLDLQSCTNPAASLRGSLLFEDRLRFDEGLCGPDGLFWARDKKLNAATLVALVATIFAGLLIGACVVFGVWNVAQVIFVIILLVIVMCLVGG